MMLKDWKWYRKWKGGIWYYVRPYDNLYSFQHVRYWINRNPLYNEVILKHEIHKTAQQTFIFCQKCGIEMVSNNYCVKDEELVHYECRNCGNTSEYNFDIAPVPILIRSDTVNV
jgi:hypothetical protein